MKWLTGICAYRWILPLLITIAASASAQTASPLGRPLSGVIAATASPVEGCLHASFRRQHRAHGSHR